MKMQRGGHSPLRVVFFETCDKGLMEKKVNDWLNQDEFLEIHSIKQSESASGEECNVTISIWYTVRL